MRARSSRRQRDGAELEWRRLQRRGRGAGRGADRRPLRHRRRSASGAFSRWRRRAGADRARRESGASGLRREGDREAHALHRSRAAAVPEPLPAPFRERDSGPAQARRRATPSRSAGYGLSREGDAKTTGTFRAASLDARSSPTARAEILLWARGTGAAAPARAIPAGRSRPATRSSRSRAGRAGTRPHRCGGLTQGILVGAAARLDRSRGRRLATCRPVERQLGGGLRALRRRTSWARASLALWDLFSLLCMEHARTALSRLAGSSRSRCARPGR